VTKETNFEHPPRGHVALLAYDSVNDRWQAVYVDASGRLQMDGADLTTRIHGWDGSAWHKLPMTWGYSDQYAERVVDTTMPAGHSNLNGSSVTDGEVWRVTGASFIVFSTSCTEVRLSFNVGGVSFFLDSVLTPSSGQFYSFLCDLTLKKDNFMFFRFYSLTLNDDAYIHFWGYKMKVAE